MDPQAEALIRGDAGARRAFFDAEAERVWRLCYRLTGDSDVAHDLVQDTFIRAFARIDRYGGRGSLRAWLHRLALNLTRDVLRRERRRGRLLQQHVDQSEAVQQPAHVALSGDVRSALDELPDALRVVVVMHDMEGYTHEEIGAALGIAAASSRARLSRAHAQLRQRLTPRVMEAK